MLLASPTHLCTGNIVGSSFLERLDGSLYLIAGLELLSSEIQHPNKHLCVVAFASYSTSHYLCLLDKSSIASCSSAVYMVLGTSYLRGSEVFQSFLHSS